MACHVDAQSRRRVVGGPSAAAARSTLRAQKEIKKTFGGKIDIVVSDMASETTGNKSLDCIRTNLLCSEVINFSISILKQRGILVSKVFMGEDFLEIRELAKKKFKNVEFYKPKSSRSESKETYIHCETLNTL